MENSSALQPDDVIPGNVPNPAYIPGYMRSTADEYFSRLKADIEWVDKHAKDNYVSPHKVFYYNPERRHSAPVAVLEEIILTVEELHKAKSLFAWCNLYRDGSDLIDWHQDQYGGHLTTVSLGIDRMFQMKKLDTDEITEVKLSHGDVYTWGSEIDSLYEHRIPPAIGLKGERIAVVIWTQTPGSGA